MFKLFDDEIENKFTWNTFDEVEKGRLNLGSEMPVFVYRLFQFTMRKELEKQFGKEKADEIFRNSGKEAGIELATNILDLELPFAEFIAHLQSVLEGSKIGILRVELYDEKTSKAIITIGEDLDCSGLPVTGETVCTYDEGFLAGILSLYTKKNYTVKEIDCWATGARVCRFEAVVAKDGI
ncbi:MAG: V4R domain-containing protein [Anaerotignum sp.]